MQNEITKLNQKINQLEKHNTSLLSKIDRLQLSENSYKSNYKIVNDLCNRQQELIASQNEMIKQLQIMRRVELGAEIPTHICGIATEQIHESPPQVNNFQYIYDKNELSFTSCDGSLCQAKFISYDSYAKMLNAWERDKPTPHGYFVIPPAARTSKFTAIDNSNGDMFTQEFQYLTSCVEYFLGEDLDDIEARDREPSTSPKPAPPAPPPPTIHNLNLG